MDLDSVLYRHSDYFGRRDSILEAEQASGGALVQAGCSQRWYYWRREPCNRLWGREEALYHLAVTYLDIGKAWLARPPLRRAAKDGDYPEADTVLKQIQLKQPVVPCRCPRFINKDLRGHAQCSVHPRLGR
jgi:hypothetical protein